jgi:hypothetical protein
MQAQSRGREAYGVLIQLKSGQKVKVELDEQFPGDARLQHEEPLPRYVFTFHEKMLNSTEFELEKYAHHELCFRLFRTS